VPAARRATRAASGRGRSRRRGPSGGGRRRRDHAQGIGEPSFARSAGVADRPRRGKGHEPPPDVRAKNQRRPRRRGVATSRGPAIRKARKTLAEDHPSAFTCRRSSRRPRCRPPSSRIDGPREPVRITRGPRGCRSRVPHNQPAPTANRLRRAARTMPSALSLSVLVTTSARQIARRGSQRRHPAVATRPGRLAGPAVRPAGPQSPPRRSPELALRIDSADMRAIVPSGSTPGTVQPLRSSQR